jgi:aminopeptidase N
MLQNPWPTLPRMAILREHAQRWGHQAAGAAEPVPPDLHLEPEELNLKLLTGQASAIFWQFLSPAPADCVGPFGTGPVAALQKTPRLIQSCFFKTTTSQALTRPRGPTKSGKPQQALPVWKAIGTTTPPWPGAGRARLRRARAHSVRTARRIKTLDRRLRLFYLCPTGSRRGHAHAFSPA